MVATQKTRILLGVLLSISFSLPFLGLKCGVQDGAPPGGASSLTSSSTPTCTPTTSASTYSPSNYSGLVLWLKADAISGLSDGDGVTTWSDSSSGGNHFTQSTAANKPLYKKEILNCQPVVRLDGETGSGGDFLQSQSTGMISTALNGATGYTVFVVAANVTVGGSSGFENHLYSFMHSSSYVGMNMNYRSDAGHEKKIYLGGRLGSGDTAKSLSSDSAVSGTGHILIGVVDIANDTMKLEGSVPVSTTGVSFSPTSWVSTSTSFSDYVGKELGKTYPFHGDIAEIILYNTILTASQRLEILDYLNKKYGLNI